MRNLNKNELLSFIAFLRTSTSANAQFGMRHIVPLHHVELSFVDALKR